jgi:phytanoyl-CoA hydroxylase
MPANLTATATAQPVFTDTHRRALADEGFASVPGIIPDDLLHDCQTVLEAWVEDMIRTWRNQGRLANDPPDQDFRTRFLAAWQAAGRPSYHRSPRGELVHLAPRALFRVLSHPALVDLAAQVLGTEEVVAHGIWNSRPKAPDQRFTDTPWHQDAQYFPAEARARMVNIWFPLHDVDEETSCLAFSPCQHHNLFRNHDDAEETGFIGLTPEDAATMQSRPMPLARGSAAVFGNLTPHRALSNRSARMRWSFDLRFVVADDALPAALAQGFVVRSQDPARLTSYGDWLATWKAVDR